ncbi:glutelin type-B 5 [Oryza brachyantha]|uniref:Cupin type-1 domain-containing protein n=1 Tax=Oryza brachyantha TaxID=4533 RepID=J3LBL3_ORYBR|nr:glutelin type-B 5 [Oryza brachyantha]XP_006647145.1 glutelin type-B 5 [Oryza brachyantha]
MANTSFCRFTIYFCVLLLCHGSMAQLFSPNMSPWHSPRQGGFRDCRFDRLQAFEPLRKVRSEAGVTEYFDERNEQFQCTGTFVVRRVIEPQGLLVPRYTNAPGMVYIIQGRGSMGLSFPGCPATYQQQFQQFLPEGQSQSQKFRDEHQKIHQFRQGDIVALPAGVAHWFYNEGDTPVVALYVFDVNNSANQLEPRQKEFLLAGNNNREQQVYSRSIEKHSGQNIFSGFNSELLSEALGISTLAAKRLQGQNDQRGEIIRVRNGLQLLKPTFTQQEQEQAQRQYQDQYSEEQQESTRCNGLDENFCTIKARLNIENPSRADTYNPRAGRITRLNSQKFPILNLVQMSATRVNLYQNAILSPFWNVNAHSLVYMVQGNARVQVVSNFGKTVFNGVLRPGQLLIIPQHYVVLKKAEREGCQYIAFKTNANSIVSRLAGKNSILRAMPVDVVANAYRISREQARSLKNNRGEEVGAFTPTLQQQTYLGLSNESEGKASE